MTASRSEPILFPVHSTVQNLPFGPKGAKSLARRLWQKGGHADAQRKSLDHDTPYAEFWMGATHQKGPSTISKPAADHGLGVRDGQSLAHFLLGDPSRTLSSKLVDSHRYLRKHVHGGMPFIFKVLSAGQALPLQAHPDVRLAQKLKAQMTEESDEHTTFDGHHKPEIALAVTPFRGFIGLASPPEIRARLEALPEVAELLHDDHLADKHLSQVLPKLQHADLYRLLLRAAVWRILCADKGHVKQTIDRILADRDNGKRGGKDRGEAGAELNGQFPGDVGCLVAPVFMNLAKLQPGECIFAPADAIHTWLSGDIIECMPSSVNVTNTAFGPEPSRETVELFAQMLSYESKPVGGYLLPPQRIASASTGGKDGGVCVDKYPVPFDEFNVVRVRIEGGRAATGAAAAELFTGSKGNPKLEGVAVVGCVRGSGRLAGSDGASESGGGSGSGEESGGRSTKKLEYRVEEGKVLVVGNGTAIRFESDGQSEEALECYVAYWSAAEKS
ncbi:Mannose-6-phosphate isomerase [Thecaphora frezii]